MNPEVREKGKLIVIKKTKGFLVKVELEDGKEITLTSYDFKDDSLNGKECEIERPGGNVQKLYIDGREIEKKSSGSKPHKGEDRGDYARPQRQTGHGGKGVGSRVVRKFKDIWNIGNTQLPRDTRECIKNQGDIDNYYLLLSKAAQLIEERKQKDKEKAEKKGTEKEEEVRKSFRFFVHERPSQDQDGRRLRVEPNGYGGLDFKELTKRLESGRASALEYEVMEVGTLRPEWRMVVGLGSASVYETSITLHHIYGFPYIPGSAVKGVTRHHIVSTLLASSFREEDLAVLDKAIDLVGLEEMRKDFREGKVEDAKNAVKKGLIVNRTAKADTEEKPKEPGEELITRILDGWDELEAVREVFGNQSQRGKVIFLDAYPEEPPEIEFDIMNPHFSEYYSGKKAPVDSMDPVPVHFLTVKNTPFRFAIMAKKSERWVLEKRIGGRNISEWVKAALIEHGVGAKTSVGYGYLVGT